MSVTYTIMQFSRKNPDEMVELAEITARTAKDAKQKYIEKTSWKPSSPDKYLFVKHPVCR